MSQTSLQIITPPVKPITLTILPLTQNKVSGSAVPAIINQANIGAKPYISPAKQSEADIVNVAMDRTKFDLKALSDQRAPQINNYIPTFNYAPMAPVLLQTEAPIIRMTQTTAEEREAIRAQKQREHSYNYQVKVREYKKLGSLRTDKEKIIKLLLICYPSLETMPSYELDRLVTEFIQRLGV
ncbi:Hypothetical protein HVR_LOCUS401 [uncultured virus]|nr:Hypothetical protein HVR_LOCUS401 [uncultured virus]